MDYTERKPASLLRPPEMVAGKWYLKGFADAYHARLAIIPRGPAGDEYRKGYGEGLAAAQRGYFSSDLEWLP